MNLKQDGQVASIDLEKNVITMPDAKKSIKIEGTPVYDTELLYSRIIGLQQSRELDIRDILAYELSAVPSALFCRIWKYEIIIQSHFEK